VRANMLHTVTRALAANSAVPALTTYDFTTAQAVVAASERADRPVILLVPPKAAAGAAGSRFIRALRTLADDAAVGVCLQLDHAPDLDLIRAAAAAGVDAVLADGSALPNDRNADFVSRAREALGDGIVLEAELGNIAGDEDIAQAQETAGMTDPDDVPGFLARSGADLLAVAVGTVHGHYKGTPRIDWERAGRIRAAAGGVPLVLHGASGIPAADLARAGTAGIGKVNINTELRTAIFGTLGDTVGSHRANGLNMLGLLADWTATVEGFTAGAHRTLAREVPGEG
jgi:tagatose 1,6-diphosphate aldolase GatY/KbaY